MRYLIIVTVVGLLSLTQNLHAQVSGQQQYLTAKALFNDKSYNLAMEAFKPLMASNGSNPFSEYASFYYALSAYGAGYLPMAKNMLLQVKQQYPKWSKLNEVNFWLGKIYFESDEFNQALNVLNGIKEKSFEQDVINMKYNFLSQLDNFEQIRQLYDNNGKDKILGEILARNIASQSLVNQDQVLLDDLIHKFKLESKGLNVIKLDKSEFKDSYRVAVLLPFLVNTLEISERPNVNQLVLDIYQGIKLAMDTLRKQGINLELYAYDTFRNRERTLEILAQDEFKSMDVIIGPLFSGPREVVQEFSYKNKINMINPISSDSEVIGQNPFSFLFMPSNETIGRKAADYVNKHARNKTGIIFYGESKSDSALAFAYKQRIEMDSFKIIATRKIRKNDTREILDILIAEGRIKDVSNDEGIGGLAIAPDSLGHIFVASDKELISTKVISAVDTRGDSIMVVGSAGWLDMPVVNYDSYQRLGAVLYASSYMQKESDTYRKFRKLYILRHKVTPTEYAAIGYDLALLLGHSLKDHGKYFQLGWNRERLMSGYLGVGYCYHKSQDNEVVPILSFEEDGLKVQYEIDENDDSTKE